MPPFERVSDRRVEEDYVIGKALGRGQFGLVLAATHKASGRPVAVKRVDKKRSKPAYIASEVDIMARLRGHPHIVTIFAVYDGADSAFVHLVVELCSGGEMFEVRQGGAVARAARAGW